MSSLFNTINTVDDGLYSVNNAMNTIQMIGMIIFMIIFLGIILIFVVYGEPVPEKISNWSRIAI